MDIFGYILVGITTIAGAVIVALAAQHVEDVYLDYKMNPMPVYNRQPKEASFIVEETQQEHHE